MIKQKQIIINLITNILAMGFSMLISILLTPYLINHLGLSAYGYIGLINNVTSFMAVITYTLTSMVARFLTFSLERNGPLEASKYISSALVTNLILGAFLFLIILFFGTNLEKYLNIQGEYVLDVRIAFIISGVAFLLNSIYLIFSSGTYARNRLDISNGILIFSNIVRVIFLFSIFSIFAEKIWYYAISSVLQVTITVVLGFISFKKLLPKIRFSIKLSNRKMSLELLSAGFFNSIILLGNNFLTQIDLIVGNKFLSAEIVGTYAAILLLPNSIRNIASALSYAFSPTTIKLYSKGNMEELRTYTNRVVKICGLLIGWPIAIISGLAIPILRIWLGKDYSQYEFIILTMLLPLTIILAVNQLYIVQQATNKVKIPAFGTIIIGVINIFLAIFFTKTLKMGIFGIVLSGVTMSVIRSVIFIPIYTATITNQSKFAYYKNLFFPLLISSFTCAIGIILQRNISILTFTNIMFSSLALTIIYFVFCFFGLTKEERENYIYKNLSLKKFEK